MKTKKQIIIKFICSILISFPVMLKSHHGEHGNSFLQDATGGKTLLPKSYIGVSEDISRASMNYSDIYRTTIFGEYRTGRSLSFVFSSNHYYYDQKERKDASRFGKFYTGIKYSPVKQNGFIPFLVFDVRIGLPTGSDTKTFTKEDYWDVTGAASTGYSTKHFSMAFRASRQYPLHYKNKYSDNIILKPVDEYNALLGYQVTGSLFLFIGYIYRTPFHGIRYENCVSCNSVPSRSEIVSQALTGRKYSVPEIFRENTGGISYAFQNRLLLNIQYRQPVHRENIRPYESAVVVSMLYFFENEPTSDGTEKRDGDR